MTPPVTALDLAHADMERGDAADRLKFYEALLDSDLILWLAEPQRGDDLSPQILPMDGTEFVLVFDLAERLANAAGEAVDSATLPGRALVQMIAGRGLGIGLNLGDAPSAILIGPDGVEWAADIMERTATSGPALGALGREKTPASIEPPSLAPVVLARLAEKLGRSAGMADAAIVVGATYEDHSTGHILAFVGAQELAHPALVEAANQAIVFSGASDHTIVDVTFLAANSDMASRLFAVGSNLPMHRPEPTPSPPKAPPGSNPDAPPKLR